MSVNAALTAPHGGTLARAAGATVRARSSGRDALNRLSADHFDIAGEPRAGRRRIIRNKVIETLLGTGTKVPVIARQRFTEAQDTALALARCAGWQIRTQCAKATLDLVERVATSEVGQADLSLLQFRSVARASCPCLLSRKTRADARARHRAATSIREMLYVMRIARMLRRTYPTADTP